MIPRLQTVPVWLISGWLLLVLSCSPKAHDKLLVGMELKYPPFEMVDPQGKPKGISVEMSQALGKHLGREVEIQNIPFDGLIPALKTAKIDLIISSMTETPERAKSIDFSDTYLTTGLCLLVSKDSGVESIEQLNRAGTSVAVKQGTTGQLYAQQHLQQAKVLVLDQENACVLEVVQGKAQAFIYDQMSVFRYWQQHTNSTQALLKPFQEEHWAIGLRKGQERLRDQVNAFLKSFRAEGGFERLGDAYLKEEKEAYRRMNVPFFF